MYSVYARRKLRPLVILLTVLFLWSQMGVLASPAHAAATNPASVSSEVYAFKDITPAYSNYIFINYLKKSGLISGFSDGTFRPQAGLTRAEIATVLVKAAKLQPETAETGFKDVSTKHWAAKNIAAAKKAGLINGYPNGTFRPEAMVTRAEGITLVLKLSKQADSGVGLPTLADVSGKHWAARPIATGLAAEMVSLTKDNKRFLPNLKFDRSSLARALAILLTRDPDLYSTNLPNYLTVTTGTVHVTRANSTTPELISKNTILSLGDSLTVDQGSSAKLDFPDGTGLRLEENSAISIKESRGRSYLKPDGSPGIAVESLNVDMKSGKMFGALATSAENENANTQSASTKVRAAGLGRYKTITTAAAATPLPWWKQAGVKRTKVKVDMPTGVAAIRGTFWENQVSSDGSFKTTLLTGDAEVTSSSGQNVSLTAGQRTEVTAPTAPPVPPAPLTATDKQEWVKVAAWAQEQSAVIVQNQEQALPPPPPVVPEPAAPKPQAPKQQTPPPPPPTPQPEVPKPPLPEPPPTAQPKPDITQIIFDALTDVGATDLIRPEELVPPPPPEVFKQEQQNQQERPNQQEQQNQQSQQSQPIEESSDGGNNYIDVQSVTLSQTNLRLVAGKTPVTLTATVFPNNATDPTLSWAVENPAIANLVTGATDKEISVIPLTAGTTKITPKTSNGVTAVCYIKVDPYVPVSFLNLNATDISLTVGGSPYILLPIIAPSDASDKTVTWTSSDTTVANVVNGVVVPLKAGTTDITATTMDGGKTATCKVTVTQYQMGI